MLVNSMNTCTPAGSICRIQQKKKKKKKKKRQNTTSGTVSLSLCIKGMKFNKPLIQPNDWIFCFLSL